MPFAPSNSAGDLELIGCRLRRQLAPMPGTVAMCARRHDVIGGIGTTLAKPFVNIATDTLVVRGGRIAVQTFTAG